MSLYAVGDVQGCCDQLQQLLNDAGFDPARDELWLTGDLVSRGPKSLETLRFVKSLGDAASSVLGNHDINLLRLGAGLGECSEAGLKAVLKAADAEELLDWLARLPLLKVDKQRRLLLVHAGLLPQWDIATAASLASEVSAQLAGDDRSAFLSELYGDQPDRWDDALQGIDRLRLTVNAMTRMRFCTRDERLDLKCKGAPGSQPAELHPWFELPHRRGADWTLVFGHWATLGFRRMPGCIAIDSGCVWGGGLTLLRLDPDDAGRFYVRCNNAKRRS